MSDASGPMQRTILYPEHLALGAKMTPFNGWDMPLYYSSILDEHKAVRTAVGIFDVSHMGQVFVRGPQALAMLDELVVSRLDTLAQGRACYSLMLHERGGIVDDIIVFRVGPEECLVVVNCANREKDVQWMQQHRREGDRAGTILAGEEVPHADGRAAVDVRLEPDRAILAVQGPEAAGLLDEVLKQRVSSLGRFDITTVASLGSRAWISRTGYTGSDGFELFVPNAQAVALWKRLVNAGQSRGIHPIGLGARDTLRLEAGLRLCGTDMDESTSPYEADLGWTVALSKPSFIGKPVLVEQAASGVARRLAGFALDEGPVPRHGCALVVGDREVGTVTSGTFSLMLNQPIGMGFIERSLATPGTRIGVMIRSKAHPATVVKLPFWRNPSAAKPVEAGAGKSLAS